MESERALEMAGVEQRVSGVLGGAVTKRIASHVVRAGEFAVAVFAPYESLVKVTPSEEKVRRDDEIVPAKAAKVARVKIMAKALYDAVDEAVEEMVQRAAKADGFREGVK